MGIKSKRAKVGYNGNYLLTLLDFKVEKEDGTKREISGDCPEIGGYHLAKRVLLLYNISPLNRNSDMKKKTKKSFKKTVPVPTGKQRLQKILAAAGIDSRRKCEELILEHAVTVNSEIIHELPAFADPDKDDIRVNGQRIKQPEKVYFLLNKPKGVICTSSDPQGRKKAVDLIDCPERVVCVGRLDADTTGAIILTNDSELVNRLTHPKYELPKTYHVVVRGRMEGTDVEKLKKGVWLAEGKTQGASLKIIYRSHLETTLQISIRQGLNRQIRRTFAQLGYKVKTLKRIQIGDIVLKGIAVGSYKPLTGAQIAYLKRVTGLGSKDCQQN